MSIQVTHDDVIGDVAGGGREVASLPEALAPVALADMLELLLDFVRGATFGPANEVGNRHVRRYLHEHVHMIFRQSTVDDRHAHLGADLPDDLSDPEAHIADQHLVPILGRPNEMIAMMECRVTTGQIRHSLSVAEASIRLKSEGFLLIRGL